ncbi:UNVERIFIED_CONTAM: hypothetical protein HDU68_002213 [Siphonaria sp. JEL0065]|nr:hypothetical protein HDU68_002213 [Siphonaria sp. JEL0065]
MKSTEDSNFFLYYSKVDTNSHDATTTSATSTTTTTTSTTSTTTTTTTTSTSSTTTTIAQSNPPTSSPATITTTTTTTTTTSSIPPTFLTSPTIQSLPPSTAPQITTTTRPNAVIIPPAASSTSTISHIDQSNLTQSSPSTSGGGGGGASTDDNSGNAIKIASTVGLFGLLVLVIAGVLYWKRLRHKNEGGDGKESAATAAVSVGGGSGGGNNNHGFSESGGPGAPEFYRDSTGSLKAGDRISQVQKQMPPVQTFMRSPRTSSDQNRQEGGGNKRQSEFSIMGSIKDDKPLVESQNNTPDQQQQQQIKSVSDSISVWNLIASYSPFSNAETKNNEQMSQEESFSESLQSAFSGIYGKYQHPEDDSQQQFKRHYDYSMQHTTSPIPPINSSGSVLGSGSGRGVPHRHSGIHSTMTSPAGMVESTIEMEDVGYEEERGARRPDNDKSELEESSVDLLSPSLGARLSVLKSGDDDDERVDYSGLVQSEESLDLLDGDIEVEGDFEVEGDVDETFPEPNTEEEDDDNTPLAIVRYSLSRNSSTVMAATAAAAMKPRADPLPKWLLDSPTASTIENIQEDHHEEQQDEIVEKNQGNVDQVQNESKRKVKKPGWLDEMSSDMPGWMAVTEDDASSVNSTQRSPLPPLVVAQDTSLQGEKDKEKDKETDNDNGEIPASPRSPPPPPPILALGTIVQQIPKPTETKEIAQKIKSQSQTSVEIQPSKPTQKLVPFTAATDKKASKTTHAYESNKEWFQPTHVSRELFFGTRSDEMSMGVGDLIHVDIVYEDGWGKAMNLSQGKKVGMVPLKFLKAVKGGIGPSKRIVRVIDDKEKEKEKETSSSKDNLVWVGALSPSDQRKSTDSTRSFSASANPRVDSLNQ